MSAPAIPTYLEGIETDVAALLVRGHHVADGDEIRAAIVRVDAEVVHHLRQGAPSVDAALGAVTHVLADRVATRALQSRELGEALVELAVVHALIGWPTPKHWFAILTPDGVVAR